VRGSGEIILDFKYFKAHDDDITSGKPETQCSGINTEVDADIQIRKANKHSLE